MTRLDAALLAAVLSLAAGAAYLDSRPVDNSGYEKCMAEKRVICCTPTGSCDGDVVAGRIEKRGDREYWCDTNGKCERYRYVPSPEAMPIEWAIKAQRAAGEGKRYTW